jgi:hypothetical protein
MNVIQFYNFSDEDFTWKYDGISYTFLAKSTTPLEDFKAEHFAQHLIDRELNRAGIVTNNQVERQRLAEMCFSTLQTVTPSEILEKKEDKKDKKKKEEVEFEDLSEDN